MLGMTFTDLDICHYNMVRLRMLYSRKPDRRFQGQIFQKLMSR